MLRKVLFLLLFALPLLAAFSAEPYISGEFTYNAGMDLKTNPFNGMSADQFEGKPGDDYEKGIFKKMLEEARWVFSAMIYGLDVTYTPSDKARGVKKLYEAKLKAEIPFGDPSLEIYDTLLEDQIYHVFIHYRLNSYQARRIDYWNSGVFNSSAAYGFCPYFDKNSRIEAIKDGIRVSLENELKPLIYNKPESIEAEVLLRASPLITVEAGKYRAFVKIRSNIKNVRAYQRSN